MRRLLIAIMLLLGLIAAGCSSDTDAVATDDDAAEVAEERDLEDAPDPEADASVAADVATEDAAGSDAAEGSVPTGSLTASDQESDGQMITVGQVAIDGAPGWIAVHSNVDDAPGPVIGTAAIPAGESTDVAVTLDEPLSETASVWPMLHVDDGEVDTYEFGEVDGVDLPVTDAGSPVMMQIEVTVP